VVKWRGNFSAWQIQLCALNNAPRRGTIGSPMNTPGQSKHNTQRRVLDLLDEALKQPVDSRQRWLASACANDQALLRQVAKLLRHTDETQPDAFAQVTQDGDWASLELNIPNYRILRKLGSGGMADVYEAERSDGEFMSRVAVKVIRWNQISDRLFRQFTIERQVLANLTHPNIVSLLDGGTTRNDMPYVVMELVEGLPLDRYLQANAPNLRQRLTLFDKICAAVEHAHAALVIHRDIKPSNILVSPDGEPKLLDFGLAKMLDEPDRQHTVAGAFTPAYASPEQITGAPLSVATDIYSLGAVLYKILTNTHAHDTSEISVLAAGQLICAGVTERPSERGNKHSVAISRDLDAITLKALAVEPQRRYASVSSLRNDLANFAARRPVLAQFDSRAYRLRKFISRHRAGFAATSISALALVVALVVSSQQTRIANQQLARATVVSDLIGDILMSPASRWDVDLSAGPDAKMSDVLELAGQHIEENLTGYPEVQVELLSRLSVALERLSKKQLSVRFSEKALTLVDAIESEELQIQALISHGKNLTRRGRSEAGLQMLLKAERMLIAEGLDRSTRYIYLLNDIGNAYGTFGQFHEQVETMQRAIALFLDVSPVRNHPALAGGYNNLASAHMNLGQMGLARDAVEQAKRIVDLPRNQNEVVHAYVYMYSAVLEFSEQNFEVARQHNQNAMTGLSRMLGEETRELAVALARQALIYRFLDRPAAATDTLVRALDAAKRADYRSRDLACAQIVLASWQGDYVGARSIGNVPKLTRSRYFFDLLSLFEVGIANIYLGDVAQGQNQAELAMERLEDNYRGLFRPYMIQRKAEALAAKQQG